MPDRRDFGAAVEELTFAFERKTSLCRPFLQVLPIDGVAISTLGTPFGTETVCASDAQAERLDELQFDLGEGPCWEALSTRRPVLASDLDRDVPTKWPMFREAIHEIDVGAVYAFPLVVGSLDIGAVDLYSWKPSVLTEADIVDAVTLAGIAALQVLRRALSTQTLKVEGPDEDNSRRVVYQATGMVLAQLKLSAADALLIIHGFAFSTGRTVREVAADVVARRLDFSSHFESS